MTKKDDHDQGTVQTRARGVKPRVFPKAVFGGMLLLLIFDQGLKPEDLVNSMAGKGMSHKKANSTISRYINGYELPPLKKAMCFIKQAVKAMGYKKSSRRRAVILLWIAYVQDIHDYLENQYREKECLDDAE